jgi:hypothetical protein
VQDGSLDTRDFHRSLLASMIISPPTIEQQQACGLALRAWRIAALPPSG